MKARRLTDKGMMEFENHLQEMEGSRTFSKPSLDKYPYSEPVSFEMDVDPEKAFDTRMEIGKYLVRKLERSEVDRSQLLTSTGFWTWLAYTWLDNFIFWKDGRIDLRSTCRYVCSANWNRYYRHYVSINYLLVSIHGAENTKIFLECETGKYKDTIEQLASYQNILNSPELISIANDLYWNSDKQKVKKNASGRKPAPGTARRFNKAVNQLRKTHYLPKMSKQEINEILPQEFENWKE